MMRATPTTAVLLGLLITFTVPSCNRTEQNGPPTVMLGESSCSECGMIISDKRFATSTVIESERGRNALLFDDFNCQLIFEHKHPELSITNRWSHDYSSVQWFETESGWFVKSPQIHSPMASNMAIFQHQTDAQVFSKPINGETLSFDSAWVLEK